jgi:N-acetylglutamate synthase-like GNAT family acetyltransferase
MSISISEPSSYESYSELVDQFQKRMKEEKNEIHAKFSNEREKGNPKVRRFIATNDNGLVVGWMTLKIQGEDLKIEGICSDPEKANSKGAAKALVTKAVNCAFQMGKHGVVTLTNVSKGTGDSFYEYMGFKYVDRDSNKMRLTVDYTIWDVKKIGTVETKRGKLLPVVEHYRKM